MKNCFVTILNGRVDDKSMIRVSEFSFVYLAGSSTDYVKQKIVFKSNSATPVLRAVGANVVNTSGETVDSAPGNNYVENKDCTLFLSKREQITDFVVDQERFSISLDVFKYSKQLTNLTVANNPNVSGDLKELSNCINIKRLSFYGSNNITGDLSVFAERDLEQLILHSCYNITGTLDDLLNSTSLFDLQLVGTKVTGSINYFLDKLKEKKKSGTLKIFSGYNTGLKYNNSSFDYQAFKFTESGWEETSWS